MTLKAGLARIETTGLGTLLMDWAGTGLRVINNCTGKGAGKQYAPLVPGLGLSSDLMARADLRANKGAEYIFKDFAPGTRWFADGTYLHPVGGSAVLNVQSGTIANPVNTLTLAAATGNFGLGTKIPIPANLLIPGRSMIHVEGLVRHSTAAGTANLNVRFGAAGGTADSAALISAQAATLNQETRIDTMISIGANGVDFNGTNGVNPGAQTAGGSNDRAGSIALTGILIVSIDVSAGTITDVFKLISYKVSLYQ